MSIKRISAEIDGNLAILSDVLEARLRMTPMRRKDKDQALIEMGLVAIDQALTRYTTDTGEQFPHINSLMAWMRGDEMPPKTMDKHDAHHE